MQRCPNCRARYCGGDQCRRCGMTLTPLLTLEIQADRLARKLGERTGGPIRPDLLTRRRDTRTQTELAPAGRRANVAEAFVAGSVGEGAHVVLVDDVFTTGATLAEAAATLLEAGAATVEAVTFARAMPPVV